MKRERLMTDFKKEIENLKKSGILERKDRILAAFSGGPDSVFLYYLLDFLKKEYELEISLLYVNHNLRSDVQDDLNFVREFSKRNGISLFIEEADVREYCKVNKKSVELGARELRYSLLEKKLKEISYDKIATGHNLDDNVETFFFRVLRGTSLKGMKGIPVRRGNIVRPLLQFRKTDILKFLEKSGEDYVRDYTNNESDYTRNYIRNEIFPMFLNVNRSFKNKVNELILEINENIYEAELTQKSEFVKLLEKNNVEISRNKVNRLYDDIFHEDGTVKKEGSKEYSLGKNKILRKNYGKLEIVENEVASDNKKYQIIKKNQSIEWYTYEVMLLNYRKNVRHELFDENDPVFRINEKLLRLDKKIDDSYNIEVAVRQRKDGDVIRIGNLGCKKIKKILIDEKILRWERDKIPIVEAIIEKNGESDNEILTVSDIRYSKYIQKAGYDELDEDEKILIIRRKNGRQ